MEISQPRGRKGRAGSRGAGPPLRQRPQMCADVATPRPGLQLVWTGPRALGSPGMRFPPQPSPQPLGPPPRRLALFLPSPCGRSGPLCGAGGRFSGAGWGLGESPCLAALPPDVGPHLPVLLLLLALWTLAPRGLPSPPVLRLLLRLLGPVAETLILIRFRSLCGLQAETERAAQGIPPCSEPGRQGPQTCYPHSSSLPQTPAPGMGGPVCRGSTPRLG